MTLSYMRPSDDVASEETYDTLNEAMERFNALMRMVDGGRVDYVSIAAGAWGNLIEYDVEQGLQMFREVDEDAVAYALAYIDEKG